MTFRSPFLPALLFAAAFAACGEHTPKEKPSLVADTAAPVLNGTQEIHIKDGGRMTGNVNDGKRNGEWASYFADGTIRSKAVFVNGVREGATKVYHDNGMLYYTGQYHADKPVGDWLFYDRTGAQVKVARYDSLGTLLEQK